MSLHDQFNEYEAELSRLIAAVGNAPSNPQAHIDLANFHLEDDDYRRAAQSFELALALKPGDMDITCNLAHCRFALGEYAEAEKHFTTLTDENPNDFFCWDMLGQCRAEQGKIDEAIEAFDCTLAHATDPTPFYYMAKLHHLKGEKQDAEYYAREMARWFRQNPGLLPVFEQRVREIETLLGVTVVARRRPDDGPETSFAA